MPRIYFDNNATTPIDPQVLSLQYEVESKIFGNPSSIHWAGREAKRILRNARELIAASLGCHETELVFTSGGTESINTVLRGLPFSSFKNEMITLPVEHHATLRTLEALESRGTKIIFLHVDSKGRVDLSELRYKISPATCLVSIMFANNEVGNIYPVDQIGALCRERNVLFHCDAVQAVGRLPVSLKDLPIDFLSFSAHKFHGPKGVGGLVVRKGIDFSALHSGGLQEGRRRAGTENVSGIAGMAQALQIALETGEDEGRPIKKMRDQLEAEICAQIKNVRIHGDLENRLSNTSNLYVEGLDGESLLIQLDLAGIAASAGSACESGSIDPSHVLKAMGCSDEEAKGSIRFSLSRMNTAEEIQIVVQTFVEQVRQMRNF